MATEPQYLSMQREERGWTFWVLSAGAHVALAVVLLYTPAKNFILAKPKAKERPPMRIRGKKLEEFVDELRDMTCEEIRMRVELLQEGQARMADNFETMHKHLFKDFEDMQRKTARGRFEKYLQETYKRTAAFHKICEQARKDKKSEPLLSCYHQESAKILAGLEEIGRGLRLIEGLANLVPLQQKTLDTQYTAIQFHRYHEDAVLSLARISKEIPRLRAESAKHKAELDKLRQALATHKQARSAKEKERETARQAEVQARKAKNTKQAATEKRRAQQCEAQAQRLQNEIRKTEHAIRETESRMKKADQTVAGYEKQKPELEKRRLSMLTVSSNVQSKTHWRVKSIVEQAEAFFRDGTVPPPPKPDEKKPEPKKGKPGK